jgi:hypothetical protein
MSARLSGCRFEIEGLHVFAGKPQGIRQACATAIDRCTLTLGPCTEELREGLHGQSRETECGAAAPLDCEVVPHMQLREFSEHEIRQCGA